jgi:preprotein translocase subunit YajC
MNYTGILFFVFWMIMMYFLASYCLDKFLNDKKKREVQNKKGVL